MKQLAYNLQKPKDKVWHDETGMAIPVNRLTKSEKLKEKYAGKIIKDAIRLHEQLKKLKAYIVEASRHVLEEVMKETGTDLKEGYKGNFTWYNFDRSIKIEINVNTPIEFDDMLIEAAKEKFKEFLNNNITTENAFVKELILDAFETRKGKLDVKRVLNLTRYRDKVNDPLFSEAVDLINKAIRQRKSKMYIRLFAKDEEGKYQQIDLNFSSIEI